ncbi:glycosyltransferase [Ammoniphilus resinae]|uniref:Glycosyltransferase involved in cell wall biosynthesis n=1 Tax=Ammoniphilus resinae TaxID=861532 RepID=A0ABS4GSH2_9BACL|nr:glycosyltransferase [Ammoniphilus resinae]MBP1932977.1 glycosyltransferase involved in cell wall biosynthesis [Ammoniphilus resinae]
MKNIAMFRHRFLPITETFIYEELIKLNKYKPYVFTRVRMNKHQFPFPRVFVEKKNRQLLQLFRRKKIRLIHARFGMGGIDLLPLKIKARLPMITSFHGHDSPDNKRNHFRYKNLHQLFRFGEAFTVTNDQMKQILIKHGCPERKVHILHSGINVSIFPYQERIPPVDEAIRILFVGRLVEKKGAEFLIRAFAQVHENFPTAELYMVGEGHLRSQLKELIWQLDLHKHVHLLGDLPHKEVVKQMKKAHLFCLPSVTGQNGDQEGIPNVLKEAMCCGLPVVSTFHSGIPELITHGVNGFLVPEKNSDALAWQITELITHPELWGIIGFNAHQKVQEDFNSKNQVQLLENLYQQTIHNFYKKSHGLYKKRKG